MIGLRIDTSRAAQARADRAESASFAIVQQDVAAVASCYRPRSSPAQRRWRSVSGGVKAWRSIRVELPVNRTTSAGLMASLSGSLVQLAGRVPASSSRCSRCRPCQPRPDGRPAPASHRSVLSDNVDADGRITTIYNVAIASSALPGDLSQRRLSPSCSFGLARG